MAAVFKKLNLKDEKEIVIINAPASFEPEIDQLTDVKIVRDLAGVSEFRFSLAFVILQDELNAIASEVIAKAKGDATVWFAYPKKSSKRYTCEFNRDTGWERLGAAGFEAVRQVAIDEDWSALRFRRVEFIKSIKRNPKMAMSKEGKKRISSG